MGGRQRTGLQSMDNRNNTIAGWVLFAGICALGLTIGSGMVFADHHPEKEGYPIEDAEAGGATASAVPLPNLLAAADVAKGEAVFAKCAACHTINSGGANGIGPNLYGTMGEPIGQGKAGFAFSDALKNVGGTWDFEKMDHWLTSPRKFANGTKMSFAGLGSAEDRANLIVYLNAQGSNLPLPAAEAAPAADAAAAPADGAAAPAADKGATAPAEGAAAAPAPAEAKK
jgi:cytochrome c